MLSSITKRLLWASIVVLVSGASFSRADAAVFRDRATFNAASQNLNNIDFESPGNVRDGSGFLEIDGVFFSNAGGIPVIVALQNGNKILEGATVGEFTRLTI